jgi:hypothetical protein
LSTCSPLGFIKSGNVCPKQIIFRRFVIVGPFTIPGVIMLIVDYLWTVLMSPYGMCRTVILHMGTVQINLPTHFQGSFYPKVSGSTFPLKLDIFQLKAHCVTYQKTVILTLTAVRTSNLTVRKVLISFSVWTFPSSAIHRKKQYSIIVKCLFDVFVFYVNVNICYQKYVPAYITFIHSACSVLFKFFLITIYFVISLKICQSLVRKKRILWNVYVY